MTTRAQQPSPTAEIVVGLGWGDEGKGATVDFLAHKHNASRVVRFNGGQQAAHNVEVDNKHHTFSNYGSGTFSNVPTWISRHCTIAPIPARNEQHSLSSVLTDATRCIHVDEDAKVTTPLHVFMNQLRETERGEERHGSTGTGFGETISWEVNGNEPLRAKHMHDVPTVLSFLQVYANAMGLEENEPGYFAQMAEHLVDCFKSVYIVVTHDEFIQELRSGHTVFEGAQGFLLDECFGQAPHNTWSTTTPANAKALLREAGVDDYKVHGCLRTYATRHGAGPMPFEGEVVVPEPHNDTTKWAGSFRTGIWERSMLDWIIRTVKPDYLSVSWLDEFPQIMTNEGELDPSELCPVSVEAYGGNRADRCWKL